MPTKSTLLYFKSAEGSLEVVSADEFRARTGVEYAPSLVLDPGMKPVNEDEQYFLDPEEWQRPALLQFFGRSIAANDRKSGIYGPLKRWLYGPDIRNCWTSDLYLAKVSDDIGLGVFARTEIVPGDMVGEYTGLARERRDGDNENVYLFTYTWRTVVDARERGNYTRFINHSDKRSNLGIVYVYVDDAWHVILVATRRIERDEQLLFNYGSNYWSARKEKPVDMATG